MTTATTGSGHERARCPTSARPFHPIFSSSLLLSLLPARFVSLLCRIESLVVAMHMTATIPFSSSTCMLVRRSGLFIFLVGRLYSLRPQCIQIRSIHTSVGGTTRMWVQQRVALETRETCPLAYPGILRYDLSFATGRLIRMPGPAPRSFLLMVLCCTFELRTVIHYNGLAILREGDAGKRKTSQYQRAAG